MSNSFTPREIVSELDRYIVGQADAKRAVAIALRNRWRRQQLPPELREEVLPKNILMIGPTGVGKTEISRRLAKLAQAPFLKVEATKFTEVGYVGRDVEQIVRDLLEISIAQIRERKRKEVEAQADARAEDRILDALVGDKSSQGTRESFRKMLRSGELDGPTLVFSHALSGLPTRKSSTMRSFARLVPSQAATGHSFHAMMPLYCSSSIRGWSRGYPRGAAFSSSPPMSHFAFSSAATIDSSCRQIGRAHV